MLTKAVSLKPNNPIAYYNMGIALQQQGKHEGKRRKESNFNQTDYADAYNNLGTSLQQQGHLESAIDAYKKAISIKPDHETR